MKSTLEANDQGVSGGDRPRWEVYPVSVVKLLPYQIIVEDLYRTLLTGHDEHHDPKHIFRSQILALQLSRPDFPLGRNVNETILLWSLALHDVGSNHHDNPDHGMLGAKLIKPFIRYPWFIAEEAEQILSNVEWHNKSPFQIPDSAWTTELRILKDADALELLRMHDGRRIELSRQAQLLTTLAGELIYRTENVSTGSDFNVVTQAAVDMGLLVA
jgi:hypothetical protein